MNKHRWHVIILICLCVMFSVFWLTHKTSILPLDISQEVQIFVKICPQTSSQYTIRDSQRCKEIANTINSLKCDETNEYPNMVSSSYYQFSYGSNEKIQISFDESTIQLNDEIYSADCSALCRLLEQTYYDHKSGKIDG